MSTTSPRLFPPTSTARLSGRSRLPPQVGHGCSTMYASSCSRTPSEAVSRYFFSTFLRTPFQLDSYEPCQRSLSYWYVKVRPGGRRGFVSLPGAGRFFHGVLGSTW